MNFLPTYENGLIYLLAFVLLLLLVRIKSDKYRLILFVIYSILGVFVYTKVSKREAYGLIFGYIIAFVLFGGETESKEHFEVEEEEEDEEEGIEQFGAQDGFHKIHGLIHSITKR